MLSYMLSGLKNNDVTANPKKTKPPIIVTVRTDIFWAIIRPPMTASPVHIE